MRKRILVRIIRNKYLREIFPLINFIYLAPLCIGCSVFILPHLNEWWHYPVFLVYHIPMIFAQKTHAFVVKCMFRDFKKQSSTYKHLMIANLKKEGLIR